MSNAGVYDRAPARVAGRPHVKPSLVEGYQRIVEFFVWIFVFCGSIALVEPSPYDFASFVALPLWFFGGFTVHRSFVLYYFLVVLLALAGFFALLPYWTDADATLYQYQSAYLTLTGLFYALYLGERTERRGELILGAYAWSALLAATCGIIGYFGLFGLGETFTQYGRASGTFKDPNVLGSYLILGALYLTQNLLLSRARSLILTSSMLVVIVAGVFLSFSRGSWGATILALILMIVSAFATSETRREQRRIAIFAIIAVLLMATIIGGLLSVDEIRDFFLKRAAVEQDYDAGDTGRFGNQLNSLPLLLERFGGFGPLHFRLIFGLDPHNSYIGAFANAGWIGGLLFILIVAITSVVGFRLMFKRSPVQRLAQVYVPTLLAFFLQGFQIDIDHWRHVWLLLGCVWGLETARRKFMRAGVVRALAQTPVSPR